jgi:Glycine zipper 2TM domain
MTSQTLFGGFVGLVLGGVSGALLGRAIESGQPSMDRGLATELGGILGGLAGAVVVAAIATPAEPAPYTASIPEAPAETT